jgi:aerotaxis receptor
MRSNLPVSQREHEFADGVTLMSTTDAQSHLTYANAAFIQVSGFDQSELLGEPHNLVRHPDMPPEAFADMWATLKAGQSWTGVIKNRRKNGDHYWVRANAAPIKRNGSTVGYMSVRTKASREEVQASEALYRSFREGRAGGRAFHKGLVVRTGPRRWLSWLQLMPTRWRLRVGLLGVALSSILAAVLLAGASAIVAVPLLLVTALGSWWLERQIAQPLENLLRQAELIATGQSVDMAPLNRVDAIGMLSRAVNQSGLNLRSLLDNVSQQVGGIKIASSEIAHGNADLSSRTEQSAASLEQTAASMAQIASTVSHNAERTQQAGKLARQTSTSTDHGRQEFDRVASTMARIQAGSHRIADITALIDGIAFQTNILALNAAVEAARAGEQGRGFAVVAGEVRSLAQRSAAAAKDIKGLIEDSVRGVEDGSRQVHQAGQAMNTISSQVQKVGELIEEIASATAEQAKGLAEVDVAVNQMDHSTQQNAALVEQSAAASMSLSQQATQLAAAVGAFRA